MLGAPGRHAAPAADEVDAVTGDARWSRRWTGWADWPLSVPTLALAALAVVVDVATAWAGVDLGSLGRVALSPALPLMVLVVARIGPARLGLGGADRQAWRELAAGLGFVLAVAALFYAVDLGRPAEAAGLVVAALGEELVFRLGTMIVLGAVAARLLGRPWRAPKEWGSAPGFVALGGSAVVFSLLPGHVSQMNGAVSTVSFASLGLVLGYTVLRTGALWPAAAVHALINVTTIATWQGAASPTLRLVVATSALLALVAGADLAARRLGLRPRVPTVIDLRHADTGAT